MMQLILTGHKLLKLKIRLSSRKYQHSRIIPKVKKAELCFRCVNNPTVRDFKLALDEAIVALKSDNEEFANHAAWQFVIDTMLKELRTIDKTKLERYTCYIVPI